MLSVIVEADEEGHRLAPLLAALTAAAVGGLVRDVSIAGGGPADLLAFLREETGAELADGLGEAVGRAKSDLLLVLGADFRPKLGWLEALARHLRDGGREAVISGEGGGFLRRAPYAVLVARSRAAASGPTSLKRLRSRLGARPIRIG